MTSVTTHSRLRVPDSPGDILAAARALSPKLRARSTEIERACRLPADVVESLRETGVFRAAFARDQGGPGLTSAEQLEVIETLSHGDPAVGWCAMIGMDSGIFAGYLEDSAVRAAFPSFDLVTAGMLAPAGRAERVPGGYRLYGRWSFASGITHADWVSAGAHTCTDGEVDLIDGLPHWRVLLVRPNEVEFAGTWEPTGLAGSGSLDYTISDVFIPAERTFSFSQPRWKTGPLSPPDLQMRKMAGVPLGTARAALDYVRVTADGRTCRAAGDTWADSYRVQAVLGECEMDYRAMRYSVYRSLEQGRKRLAQGITLDDLTVDERTATMLTRAYAFRTARSIVRRLYDLVGAKAIYESSPLDRWMRDLETMCQHTVAQEQILQSAGAHLVGGRPQFPLALGFV